MFHHQLPVSEIAGHAHQRGCASAAGRWAGVLLPPLLLASGCCGLILSRPVCDPKPLLTLKLPARIETLAGLPRDGTSVENGINKRTGGPQPGRVKELFDLHDDFGGYNFTLYFDETAAKEGYEFENSFTLVPVFSETKADGAAFALLYVNKPRTDPEGGCKPYGYYSSGAHVRLRNLVVGFGTRHDQPISDALTKAARHLAEMLTQELAAKRE
ncbi:MAG TPA: hypothetical protein VLT83_09070 [Opitutaceae bacterium]|nr:hypothetical protein [Opitutaceae bacterium]